MKRCSLPYTRLEIQSDGRLSTFIDGYTLGKVADHSIYDIWIGTNKAHPRDTLEQNWPMSMCFRCCGVADSIALAPAQPVTAGSKPADPVTLSLL